MTLALVGCGKGTVAVQVPTLSPPVQELCSQLKNVLPERLESLTPRVISPATPFVHAWGNPAVVLTCGVPVPAGYSRKSSETTVVDGVPWFEQPGSKVVVWTALLDNASRQTVNVQLQVPTKYDGQGAFLVDLAKPLQLGLAAG